MPHILRRLAPLAMLVMLTVILSGCWLRATFGNVVYTTDISKQVDTIIGAVFADATVAACLQSDEFLWDCKYIVDGEPVTSSIYLVSELGISGVLIDPLVVQVPADIYDFSASYDDESGYAPLVAIPSNGFDVQPGVRVEPEPGHTFFILSLPPAVEMGLPSMPVTEGQPFDLEMHFRLDRPLNSPQEPISVKLMFTGRVTVNGHYYYVPMIPCTADFADIPEVLIPVADAPLNLQTAIGELVRQNAPAGCNRKVYSFLSVPPPDPNKVFLPFVYY